jgi:serine/threonine protein kinase
MGRFPFPPFLTVMSDPTHTHGPVPESDLTRSNPVIPPIDGEHPTATAGDGSTFAPVLIPVAPPGYEILEELGRGGMGVVYKARQLKLNRLIALKMLRGMDLIEARDLLRFLAEAEAVAAVVHPHVVQVYEVGQHEGRPYMALEYPPGGTLADLLKRRKETGDHSGRLAPREAADLVARLAQAVQAAHDQGIVHRDLKPANILFGKDEGRRVKEETNTSGEPSSASSLPLHPSSAVSAERSPTSPSPRTGIVL